MIVEPPSSDVADGPREEGILGFRDMDEMFAAYPEDYVEDPATKAVRSPSSSSKAKEAPAPEVPSEVPKVGDDKSKHPDPRDLRRGPGERQS